jgi:hypothetical protein
MFDPAGRSGAGPRRGRNRRGPVIQNLCSGLETAWVQYTWIRVDHIHYRAHPVPISQTRAETYLAEKEARLATKRKQIEDVMRNQGGA